MRLDILENNEEEAAAAAAAAAIQNAAANNPVIAQVGGLVVGGCWAGDVARGHHGSDPVIAQVGGWRVGGGGRRLMAMPGSRGRDAANTPLSQGLPGQG